MEDNAGAKRILSTLPPEDWRSPGGRPRITWLSSEHCTAGSEIPWCHTAWSNGCGPEPVSVEDVVDIRRYAILSCMPEMMTPTTINPTHSPAVYVICMLSTVLRVFWPKCLEWHDAWRLTCATLT